jgi:hypothetical protein
MFTTIDPKMRADLYEGATFKLGRTFGAEIQLPIKYRLLDHLSLSLTPYFTYWQITESDPETISGSSYVEPDSTTYIKGVRAGLTFDF